MIRDADLPVILEAAPNVQPPPLQSGVAKHTNLTGGAPASCGGELWLDTVSPDLLHVNGGSGRYWRRNDPRGPSKLADAVRVFEGLGFRVISAGWTRTTIYLRESSRPMNSDKLDSSLLDRVFGEGEAHRPRPAQISKRQFVRGIDLLTFDESPRATGRRLTATEALDAYGFEKLAEVATEGSAVICESVTAAGRVLRERRETWDSTFDVSPLLPAFARTWSRPSRLQSAGQFRNTRSSLVCSV